MALLIFHSGALGAGLVILSRFPIISSSIHPYSLNGEPIDVVAGDWFVGKAAASILIVHPVLGQVQIFNTHVSLPTPVFHMTTLTLGHEEALRERRKWTRGTPLGKRLGVLEACKPGCRTWTLCYCSESITLS